MTSVSERAAAARLLRRRGLRVRTSASIERARALLADRTLGVGMLMCEAGQSIATDVPLVRLPRARAARRAAMERAIERCRRVEAERRTRELEQIVAGLADGVLHVDRNGRILFANAAAAELVGCAPDELLGQPLRTYMPLMPLDAPSAGEDVCWRAGGGEFAIEYKISMALEDGRRAGAIVAFRDISRRRERDDLRAMQLAVASHELRSPLTSLRSALGLLGSGHMGQLSAKGERMLEIAVANTERLIRLVNDVLDLERLEAGYVRLTRVVDDADELMTEAANVMRPLAEQAGVELRVLPSRARVAGDRDRLLQVLINLVGNAIKFSPPLPTGGTVWLDAEEMDGELLIRVRDEGRGIPADKLESIFERFAQVRQPDAREKQGTGLGLAIARTIVEQHGGHIWAESTIGVGTTVCIALPAAEAFENLESADCLAAA